MNAQTATAALDSPVGRITLTAQGQVLTSVRIGSLRSATPACAQQGDIAHRVLGPALEQIAQWFAGTLTRFDLPLAPAPNPEAQALRAAIAAIPYGETMTYGTVAESASSAARAIGQACKTNPFPLIIPCHRVVSTSGPEFYSGGDGPRTKTWLLDFEYGNLPDNKRTRLI